MDCDRSRHSFPSSIAGEIDRRLNKNSERNRGGNDDEYADLVRQVTGDSWSLARSQMTSLHKYNPELASRDEGRSSVWPQWP